MREIKNKVHFNFNLKNNLKKEFVETLKNDKDYNTQTELIQELVIDFLEKRKYDLRNKDNNKSQVVGIFVDKELKEELRTYINETKEFNNMTEVLTMLIYNYCYKNQYNI